jgi:hypothetical protein
MVDQELGTTRTAALEFITPTIRYRYHPFLRLAFLAMLVVGNIDAAKAVVLFPHCTRTLG